MGSAKGSSKRGEEEKSDDVMNREGDVGRSLPDSRGKAVLKGRSTWIALVDGSVSGTYGLEPESVEHLPGRIDRWPEDGCSSGNPLHGGCCFMESMLASSANWNNLELRLFRTLCALPRFIPFSLPK